MYADAHCDTLTRCFDLNESLYKNSGHLDEERLIKSGCVLQVMAIWIEPKYENGRAFKRCNEVLDFWDNNKFKNIKTVLAVEGGSSIEGSIEKLYHIHKRGVKILTLTWNGQNEIGNGALSGNEEGLTKFGKKVLSEMEKLNMICDVSHLNDKGFYDVFENFSGKIMASHSNCRELCGWKRNLTDEQIKMIIENKGFIGLNFCSDFLHEDSSTVTDIIRHCDRILELGGENTVGFGSDFDGVDKLPEGVTGVESMECIYNEFCKMGYKNNLIDKIFYGNLVDFTENLKN